jgi:spore coat protein A
VHLHGGHLPSRFDGQPELTFFPGEFDVYEYPNKQEPATLWYHDHGLGITRLNVYMGLAAYYLLRPDCTVTPDDPECNGSLPPKAYEVPAVIQDRSFDERDQLLYPARIVGGGFYGDKVLVNGKVWPYLNVDQGKYRFRFLNGSQAREYTLRLENLAVPGQVIPLTLIGTDGGLIGGAPIDMNTLHMVPAERFDVVIDFAGFAAGTEIVLRNDEVSSPRLPNIMKFIVTGQAGHTAALPVLPPVDIIPPNESVGTRYWNFINVPEACAGGEWLIQSIDGPDPATAEVLGEHWDDIDAYPLLGTTEIWEFINESNMMHPMHVHLVQFQILDRCPVGGGTCETLAPHEIGTWKDTVRVPAGTRVKVIMRFEDYLGKFPAHCHLLDHEDHEMMRQFQTTSGICDNDGICEFGEEGITCPDCGYPADPAAEPVSGAFCGNALCEIGDGEDFISCPQDCAGKEKGKSAFNCGSDDLADPGYNCGFAEDGFTVEFDGCITNDFYCRVMPRVIATCGDQLCEGQEQVAGDTYCAVDCEVQQECVYADPSVSIAPAAQDITVDGGSVTYTVSIANNDSGACMPTTFNLLVDDSDNGDDFILPSTLDTNPVTLAPGGTTDVILTVTAQSGGTSVNDTNVIASDSAANHADVTSNQVTTTINVAACEYVDPTVSVTPAAQEITTDGGSAVYTVAVTNNDTASCPPTLFNLAVSDTNITDFITPSTVGQNPLGISPGGTVGTTLTVTAQPGVITGTNITAVTASEANHNNVTSNNVTSTINVQQFTCSDITNRNECRNTPDCEWVGGGKNGTCQEVVVCTPTPGEETQEISCTDGIDNDCDGLIDCNDNDCSADPACDVVCTDIPGETDCLAAGCSWNKKKGCR